MLDRVAAPHTLTSKSLFLHGILRRNRRVTPSQTSAFRGGQVWCWVSYGAILALEGTASASLSLHAVAPDTSRLGGVQPPTGSIEVLFRADPCVWDGRFSDVAWLQELPKPISKVTWDCPVAISPKLASDLGLANGDLLEVSVEGESITGPAWITPGQSSRTVVLYFVRRLGGARARHDPTPPSDRWL